jgi:plasmid stabilization system protein ParE
MRFIFSELAQQELEDASGLYELEQGLSRRFRDEVKQAILRIGQFPMAWPVERGEVRKCLLHRFPYKILYSIEADHIFIIAIAHQHRRPDYWVDL